jgi:hypothetical protein
VFLSHQQACGTTPTACSRFAVLSRIEILHVLLEHFYDSRRNENAGSVRRLHRRQPVARSQDLLSPPRQFQRRVAVVGSVAHLVAKDSGGVLAMSLGGDRGKDHARDGQEAVSQVPLLAAATTVQLWDWPPPVQSAPRRLLTPTSSSRWGSAPGKTLVASGCGTWPLTWLVLSWFSRSSSWSSGQLSLDPEAPGVAMRRNSSTADLRRPAGSSPTGIGPSTGIASGRRFRASSAARSMPNPTLVEATRVLSADRGGPLRLSPPSQARNPATGGGIR